MPGPARLALLAAALLASGCGGLTWLRPVRVFEHPVSPNFNVGLEGYRDVVGVIHVHTRYSHDAHGTFEGVVRAANAQRLDYVIVTEHNNLRALVEGRQGWHGGTLVLIGMELSTRGGHYLAMNVTQEIDVERLTTQQVIDEVARQGGLGFIAHPFFKKREWTDYGVTGFTGIEGYNVAHDTLDENRTRLALWVLTVPQDLFFYSIINRPYDPLSRWDALIAERGPVVGIGSTDAHEFHAFNMKFAPYDTLFRLSRTHLLIPSGDVTPEGVHEALRRGHAYFSIEFLAEARGFTFAARRSARVEGIMGDTVAFGPELTLSVGLPASAEIVLYKDGAEAGRTIGQTWDVPVTGPGAYRVEVTRHDKPWIFSNPIYIVPPADLPATEPEAPTQP